MSDELKKDKRAIDELWKATFAQSCLDIFGAPISVETCLNKDEKFYFSYCTICLAMAMKQNAGVWTEYAQEGLSPEEAAYSFAEFYESEYGETLVPLYKTASPFFDEKIEA